MARKKNMTGVWVALGAAVAGVVAYLGLRKGGFDGVEGVRGLGAGGRQATWFDFKTLTENEALTLKHKSASFLKGEFQGIVTACFPAGSSPHYLGYKFRETSDPNDTTGDPRRYILSVRVKYSGSVNRDRVVACMYWAR